MSRRINLPGADELFRATAEVSPNGVEEETTAAGRASGRVRHDEKVTVYMTADELLDLEHARLSLRRELAQTVDRGRLVRAAVALALADFADRGPDSDLARRLLDR